MKFDGNGEFPLSRDIHELRDTTPSAQAMVTGSYAVGSKEVMVVLRIVRLEDDFYTMGSVSYTLPLGPNTRSLITAAAT
jgi:hypothetical protein